MSRIKRGKTQVTRILGSRTSEQCREESHPIEVWRVIKNFMLSSFGNAQEDARLDRECPARVLAKKVVELFLNLKVKEMATQIISELVDEGVADDLTVDQ